MVPFARTGDTTFGICTGHIIPISTSGTVIGASSNVIVAGCTQARLGDTVISSCGHTGTINSGSSKVFVNGIPAARMGDSFSGTYSGTIISGAPKVLCG